MSQLRVLSVGQRKDRLRMDLRPGTSKGLKPFEGAEKSSRCMARTYATSQHLRSFLDKDKHSEQDSRGMKDDLKKLATRRRLFIKSFRTLRERLAAIIDHGVEVSKSRVGRIARGTNL